MKPIFFPKPVDFRKWLAKNHHKASVLLVGYYKVVSGKPSMTWPESVDEALSYGWIDGVRKGVDADGYTIRFTPRRQGSFWSNKNIASAKRLIKTGRMKAAGLQAYKARLGVKSGAYSFEQKDIASFSASLEKNFKANKKAWEFFNNRPPGYQKAMRHWVVTAKQEKTQIKRLERLIEVSQNEKESRSVGAVCEQGVDMAKQAWSKIERPHHPMPANLRKTLVSNRLMSKYKMRPPYQQNDYTGWVKRTKLPATKKKRLDPMIAELKKGNVYMNMKWKPW